MTEFKARDWADKKIAVLSGGVGGARLVDGLARILPPGVLRIIANTGDDFEHLGLWISPDLDTLMYTLAGKAPIERGWGIEGDSFTVLDTASNLGIEGWFQLGDQDLATHLVRTQRLREGASLTEITRELCTRHGVQTRILPMTDMPHLTFVRDRTAKMHSFQDWLVRYRAQPVVDQIVLMGDTRPAPGVCEAIAEADLVILPPSNPFVSIDPILRLGDVRALLRNKKVIGVSPIIGGAAVKGPLAEMITALRGTPASSRAIAAYYEDLLDVFVIAAEDRWSAPRIALETRDILMNGIEGRTRLARDVLTIAKSHHGMGESGTCAS